MSLSSEVSKLTGFGRVVIQPNPITVDGFDAENCTCRDVTVQACLWAIGELQREVLRAVEKPGGGSIGLL